MRQGRKSVSSFILQISMISLMRFPTNRILMIFKSRITTRSGVEEAVLRWRDSSPVQR